MSRNYLAEMENSEILTRPELSQEELRVELLQFQDLIAGMVYDDADEHRIDEVIVHLEKKARDKGVDKNPQFRKGMGALRRINKEIAISMAGKRGEERVTRTLDYISRPNYKFSNVYISDGERETELDNVILTEAGFIILEVKNVKADITISETGRILYNNEECYHDNSICEKMQRKRELLLKEVIKNLSGKGMSIPVRIDSYIVFSAPKGVFVNVTDRCHQEKYCLRGKLPFIIDAYNGEGLYSEQEIEAMNSIMEEMKTHQKRFTLEMDFNEIRKDIANALELCLDVKEELFIEAGVDENPPVIVKNKKLSVSRSRRKQTYRRFTGALIGSAASLAIIAGTMMTGLAFHRA